MDDCRDGEGLLMELEPAFFREQKESLRAEFERRVQEQVERWESQCGEVGRLKSTRFTTRALITFYGEITVRMRLGLDARTGAWTAPAAAFLGLRPGQRFSPSMERRLCVQAAQSLSYGSTAKAALESGWIEASEGAVRNIVIRAGGAGASEPPAAPHPHKAGPDDTLVVMADGWNARHRGKDWGKKRRRKGQERVHWHEVRSAVLFTLKDLAQVSEKRKALLHKFTVAAPADTSPRDFGLMLERDARRMGLTEARAVFFVMDGGVWLWRIHEDRFEKCSMAMLDFYHLSQHLHTLARAVHSDDEAAARAWCARILHSLKHQSPKKLFATLDQLVAAPPADDPAAREIIRRETAYFESHRQHMDYAKYAKKGVPIGSGSVESLCSQLQNRLKRTGQFWSKAGFAALLQVIVRYRNGELLSLWAA
jgi:hypothetical protein